MVELRETSGEQLNTAYAGDTLNTATHLARLAGDNLGVSYVTVLGEDSISDRMLNAWKKENLDTSLVQRRADKLPGLYLIENDSSGERRFHYWRNESAAKTLFDKGADSLFPALGQFDCLYLSGITLAIISDDARERLFTFLQSYTRDGGALVFDSNYRARLWNSEQHAIESLSRLWEICTIGLPSLDDEKELFGENEASVIERLLKTGMNELVLKCGDGGPRIFEDGVEILLQPLPQAQKIVDTTGAGDSFNAGYLSSRLCNNSVQQAVGVGHDLALYVISQAGAIPPLRT